MPSVEPVIMATLSHNFLALFTELDANLVDESFGGRQVVAEHLDNNLMARNMVELSLELLRSVNYECYLSAKILVSTKLN